MENIIDLDEHGQLISPFHVNGKLFYVWDFDKDGLQGVIEDRRSLHWISEDYFKGEKVSEFNRDIKISGVHVLIPTSEDLLEVADSAAGCPVGWNDLPNVHFWTASQSRCGVPCNEYVSLLSRARYSQGSNACFRFVAVQFKG